MAMQLDDRRDARCRLAARRRARARRRRRVAGAGLPVPAGAHRRAVRRRRPGRHLRAAARAAAAGELGQPSSSRTGPAPARSSAPTRSPRARADGYTLLLMSNTHTVNESLIPNKPFQLLRDFVPVAPINYSDLVLVVHPAAGDERRGAARAGEGEARRPQLRVVGPRHAVPHGRRAVQGDGRRVDIVHVPYKGSSGARTDVLGGQVRDDVRRVDDDGASTCSAGKVKALGTTGTARSAVMPDVPTVAEAGVPGYEATIWLGLMAPKGTPPAIVAPPQRRDREDRRAAGVAQGWAEQGAMPMSMGADEFAPLPRAGHRQVGAHRQGLGREAGPVSARPRRALRLLSARARRRASSTRVQAGFEGRGAACRRASAPSARCAKSCSPVSRATCSCTAAMLDALIAAASCGAARACDRPVRTGDRRAGGRAAAGRRRRGEALKATLLAAGRIHFPDPERATAGMHVAKVVRRPRAARRRACACTRTARRRCALWPRRRGSGTRLHAGDRDRATPGLKRVGALPAPFALATAYAAAATDTQRTALAQALVALLCGSGSRELRRRAGFAD